LKSTVGFEPDAACTVFAQLGAAPDLARVEALARSGAAPNTQRANRAGAQVLRLLATGTTNHAIAQRRSTHAPLARIGRFSRSRLIPGPLASEHQSQRERCEMRKLGSHAVVLGASLAGLLAARVLSDAYERVTVVERDVLGDRPEHRRGVPQGRHAHVLLPRGAQVLDELFPGLLDDLAAGGAQVIRDLEELRFSPAGHRLCLKGHRPELVAYQASRPLLERHVRARVRALPAVKIMDRCEVVGLLTTAARDRVTGVRMRPHAARVEETLDADLVLDATGRGGRAAAWLAAIGYDQPPQEQLAIRMKYATRHLRLRPDALPGHKFVAIGAEPGRPTGLVLFAEEQDQWVLTLIGYDGHHPPTDPEGFLAFVETTAPPDVVAAIRGAEPLDDIVAYRFPANLRRRYERLRRFPTGLLVFGDALCSTNPAYALGMSVAALQAAALHDTLVRGDHHLAGRFFRSAAKPIDRAWQLTVGSDLALPQVQGPRPLPVRVINAYVNRALTAAERDPAVAEQFLRIASLQDPVTRLLRPSTARRVMLGNLRRHPEPATDTTTRVAVSVPRT
jgi:2-polyprenyl-6-methoxyphenol hydroxylase-like FAD-dependent oxidoreductase